MHICDNLHEFGFDRDGGFAEYVAVPAICAWKNNPALPWEIASIQEPLGNSVHAVANADVKGKDIAIFGCGPTGLFAVGLAKVFGAKKVGAIDIDKNRLELAKKMGADELFDGASKHILEELKTFSKGVGLDIVFEMSGSKQAMINGLFSLRKGGKFIAFGIFSEPIELDVSNLIIMREITIAGVFGRIMFDTWQRMKELLDSKIFDPSPVITHRFRLSEFEKAIKILSSQKELCGKIVLFP
jgi:threonine 3-dehydrogenase